MNKYCHILHFKEITKDNNFIKNNLNYKTFNKKFKRYGTINGINLKDMNINIIFQNLNTLNCEEEESTELLHKIDSMDDDDFEKLTKIIEFENLKLKESIFLNHLLYYPDKIFQENIICQDKISTDDQKLFLYKKLLEKQEMILKKENILLNQQLEYVEKLKNLQNNIEKLNEMSPKF